MTDAPPADGVVFDFDGVIVDSRAPVCTAVNAALAAHGFARRNPAELDPFIGPPVLAAFAELTGEPEGSDAVGVTWGIGNRTELQRAGADVIIDRPDELLARLAPGGEPCP